MADPASEVAISRLIGKSRDIISENGVLTRKLHLRISKALHIFENILDASSTPCFSSLIGEVEGINLQRRDPEALSCAREAEDAVDMFLMNVSTHPKLPKGCMAAAVHGVVRLFNSRFRVRMSRVKAGIFAEKLEELSHHFAETHKIESPMESPESSLRSRNHKPREWQTILSIDSAISGREDTADRLASQLTDSEWLRMIFIVGNEGVGKTALVRNVYSRRDTEHHFECQAWISDPDKLKLESILVIILMQSTVKGLKNLELMEISDLRELLHRSLIELRYLIVLDDLKSAHILDELMYILPDSRNGSRVIVTCRDINHVPLPQEPWGFHLPVNPLNDENSARLLLKHCPVNDPGLTEMILGKGKGSPPKLLLFGVLCAALELKRGESSPTVQFGKLGGDLQLQDLMHMSYRSLPSWVKPCLLYLCLFPKESEISTSRIFRLWNAEGLFCRDDHSAEDCFKELANRNLVQVVRRREADNSTKTCQLSGHLHDYLSELAIKFGQVFSPSNPTAGSPWLARYSSDHTILPPQDAKTTSLIRSYLSFNTQKLGMRSREVEMLLKPLVVNQNRALLRVLDLEGIYKPVLPKQFGDLLLNLRYLGLRWTILDSLPESVSKLSRLETLDLKHTNVTKLPSSILQLKYLRYLYLNEVSFDKYKPTESCLRSIQTLWGVTIGMNSSFLGVLGKLKGIRKLRLTCDATVIKQVTKSISTMTMIESLRIQSRDLFGQPSDLKTSKDMKELKYLSKLYLLGGLKRKGLSCFPENLRVLTLSMSELTNDPMSALGQLQHLVILRLLANSYKGEDMVCEEGKFLRLRLLSLWKLEELNELRIQEGAILSLEELEMRDCQEMRNITGLQHASKLKQIKLTKVKEDFVKKVVESTRLKPETLVTSRELIVSSPEDKKDAA